MTQEKYTLQTGTLGHRSWLMGRKNKTLTTGKADLDSVLEICFAYVTDPVELHKLHGKAADDAIKAFSIPLTNEDFQKIQDHATVQLLKFTETNSVPKKNRAAAAPKAVKSRKKR